MRLEDRKHTFFLVGKIKKTFLFCSSLILRYLCRANKSWGWLHLPLVRSANGNKFPLRSLTSGLTGFDSGQKRYVSMQCVDR